MSKDSSGLSPQERHAIINETMKSLNKTEKVFHLRWTPGDLLNEKILKGTPIFWYMKFGWSREDVEKLFLEAKIWVDPVFEKACDQVFGSEYKGPRWLPPDKQLEKQAKWKRRAVKKTGPWWKVKKAQDLHRSQEPLNDYKDLKWEYDQKRVSDHGLNHSEYKMSKKNQNKEEDTNKPGYKSLKSSEINRKESILDKQKLEPDKTKIWQAVSNYGEDNKITPEKFSENLKEKNIQMDPLVSKKLFEHCAPKGFLNQEDLNKLLGDLDSIKTGFDPSLGSMTVNDLNFSLKSQSLMKRVLLAASNNVPFSVDEFLVSKVNIAHMAPGVLLGKLADRDVEWDFRLKAMEEVAQNLGDDPELDEYFEPQNMSTLLMGWMTQTLDNREQVSKPAIQMLPQVYNEMMEKGNTDQALSHLDDVVDGLFTVLNNPRHKNNKEDAKQALDDILKNVREKGDPETILYAAGLLTEQTDISNNTNPEARKEGMNQLKKLLFGDGYKEIENITPKTKDSELKKIEPNDNKEWLLIGTGNLDGPSDKLYNEGLSFNESSNLKGRQYKPQQNASDVNSNDPTIYGEDTENMEKKDEEMYDDYDGDLQFPKYVQNQQTLGERDPRSRGKLGDYGLRYGNNKTKSKDCIFQHDLGDWLTADPKNSSKLSPLGKPNDTESQWEAIPRKNKKKKWIKKKTPKGVIFVPVEDTNNDPQVQIKNKDSGKFIRLGKDPKNNKIYVDCDGKADDPNTLFNVRPKPNVRPETIQLESVEIPSNFLSVKPRKGVTIGNGDKSCNLNGYTPDGKALFGDGYVDPDEVKDIKDMLFQHVLGDYLRIDPKNDSRLDPHGRQEELNSEFETIPTKPLNKNSDPQIQVRSKKNKKYVKITKDPKNNKSKVRLTNDDNDPETVFNVRPKPDVRPETIQLESNTYPGDFISVKPKPGVCVGDGDDTCNLNGYVPNGKALLGDGDKLYDLIPEPEEPQDLLLQHPMKKYIKTDPDDETKLNEKGNPNEKSSHWRVIPVPPDPRNPSDKVWVQLKNKDTGNFLRLGSDLDDPVTKGEPYLDCDGGQWDPDTVFEMISRPDVTPNTIQLESDDAPGNFVSVTPKDGVVIGPGDEWSHLNGYRPSLNPLLAFFDEENETPKKKQKQLGKDCVFQHPLGDYIKIDPKNNNKLHPKGKVNDPESQWEAIPIIPKQPQKDDEKNDNKNDDPQVKIKNKNTGKYLKLSKDPKTNKPVLSCDSNNENDPDIIFNVRPKPNVKPECIQLESNENPNNFVSVKPKEGVCIGDGDDSCNLNGYTPDGKPLIGDGEELYSNPIDYNEPKDLLLQHPLGDYLRTNPKNKSKCDPKGKPNDPLSQWETTPTRPNKDKNPSDDPQVQIKNKDSGKYLRLKKDPKTGKTSVDCDGDSKDPDTIFNVRPQQDVSPDCIQLESNENPNNYVSVKPKEGVCIGDGDPSCNFNGYRPRHNPLLGIGDEEKDSKPLTNPVDMTLQHPLGDFIRTDPKDNNKLDPKGDPTEDENPCTWIAEPLKNKSNEDPKVRMKNKDSGKYMRIRKDPKTSKPTIDANGTKSDPDTVFIVRPKPEVRPETIQLESKNNPGKFVGVKPKDGVTIGDGNPDVCNLNGYTPNGRPLLGSGEVDETHDDPVKLNDGKPKNITLQHPLGDYIQTDPKQKDKLHPKGDPNEDPSVWKAIPVTSDPNDPSPENEIQLQNKETGKFMKISKDPKTGKPVIDASGDNNDPDTIFKVKPKPNVSPECIQLESKQHPKRYVSVKPKEGVCIGSGDPSCNLNGYKPYMNPLLGDGFVSEDIVPTDGVFQTPLGEFLQTNPKVPNELDHHGHPKNRQAQWEIIPKNDPEISGDDPKVQLRNKDTGKYARLDKGLVDCNGEKDDPNTVFNVRPKPDVRPETIQFESDERPGEFISVKPKEGVCIGDGDPSCNFNGYKPDGSPLIGSGDSDINNPISYDEPSDIVFQHDLGDYLRVDPKNENRLDPKGNPTDELAQFEIFPPRPERRNNKNKKKIDKNDKDPRVKVRSKDTGKLFKLTKDPKTNKHVLTCDGEPDDEGTIFRVRPKKNVSPDTIQLESEDNPGKFVSVKPKPGVCVGNGDKSCNLNGYKPSLNPLLGGGELEEPEEIKDCVFQHPLGDYIRTDPKNENKLYPKGKPNELPSQWEAITVKPENQNENDDPQIKLKNKNSGKYLKLSKDPKTNKPVLSCDGINDNDPDIIFNVRPKPNVKPECIQLESNENPNNFVSVKPKEGVCIGDGDDSCNLNGYTPDGRPLIGDGDEELFDSPVNYDEPNDLLLQHPLGDYLRTNPKNKSKCDPKGKPNDPLSQWETTPTRPNKDKNPSDDPQVQIKNKDSGKYLRLKKDPKTGKTSVDCDGDSKDPDTIFNVRPKPDVSPDCIQLESNENPNNYVSVKPKEGVCIGDGDPSCNFNGYRPRHNPLLGIGDEEKESLTNPVDMTLQHPLGDFIRTNPKDDRFLDPKGDPKKDTSTVWTAEPVKDKNLKPEDDKKVRMKNKDSGKYMRIRKDPKSNKCVIDGNGKKDDPDTVFNVRPKPEFRPETIQLESNDHSGNFVGVTPNDGVTVGDGDPDVCNLNGFTPDGRQLIGAGETESKADDPISFDDGKPKNITLQHPLGEYIKANPNDKLRPNGDPNEDPSIWKAIPVTSDPNDPSPENEIQLQNKETGKFMKISKDPKTGKPVIDASGDNNDPDTIFKVKPKPNVSPECIQLESKQHPKQHVSVKPKEGVCIGNGDPSCNLNAYKPNMNPLLGIGSQDTEEPLAKDCTLQHPLGDYIRTDPKDKTKVDPKGTKNETLSQWESIPISKGKKRKLQQHSKPDDDKKVSGESEPEIIQMKNKDTGKYMRLGKDPKTGKPSVDCNGKKNDVDTLFNVVPKPEEGPNCFQLQSQSDPEKFVSIKPKEGICVGDGDPSCNINGTTKDGNPLFGSGEMDYNNPVKFDEPNDITLQHPLGDYIRQDPKNENKLDPKGNPNDIASQWVAIPTKEKQKNSDPQIQLQNKDTGKFMKISKDPKTNKPIISGDGDRDDPETVFNVRPKPKVGPDCIQLESEEHPKKFVSVKPKEGVNVANGDPSCNLNAYKPNNNPILLGNGIEDKQTLDDPVSFIDPEDVALQHPLGDYLRRDPKRKSKLDPKGKDPNSDPCIWEIIPQPNDESEYNPNKDPKVKLKNKDTGKFIRLGKDPKTNKAILDCNGNEDDPNNVFNVKRKPNISPDCVQLESDKNPGDFISVKPKEGVCIGNGDPSCNFNGYKPKTNPLLGSGFGDKNKAPKDITLQHPLGEFLRTNPDSNSKFDPHGKPDDKNSQWEAIPVTVPKKNRNKNDNDPQIKLKNKDTGKFARLIKDPKTNKEILDVNGDRNDPGTTFNVRPKPFVKPECIQLESNDNPNNFISVKPNEGVCIGDGDPSCNLNAYDPEEAPRKREAKRLRQQRNRGQPKTPVISPDGIVSDDISGGPSDYGYGGNSKSINSSDNRNPWTMSKDRRGEEMKEDPDRMTQKEIGDEFRNVLDNAIKNGLMDPNKSNSNETAKLVHVMNQVKPGYSNNIDKEARRRYFKWSGFRKPTKKIPRKALPPLRKAEKRLHKINQDVKVVIKPPTMPDI